MRIIIALALFAVVAGCINESTDDCGDIGCEVNITPPEPTGPNCGDGILEEHEECEIGLPCTNGYCQQCKCIIPKDDELVEDCESQCLTYGYKNSSVVDDGECTYTFGVDDPCAVRCSYRKIFPMVEQGKVCCCRKLIYIKCRMGVFDEKCECPSEAEVSQLCADNRPDPELLGKNK